MATNERRKDKAGEMQDQTTWFRVTLWGRQAETASQYLTKGRPVYIEGRLRVEEWTDRDGKPRHTLEVHATDMQFIGGGRGEQEPPMERAAAAGASTEQTITQTTTFLFSAEFPHVFFLVLSRSVFKPAVRAPSRTKEDAHAKRTSSRLHGSAW
jgi:single stranded DNA-binding protein